MNRRHIARKLLTVARTLMASDEEFNKGYDFGVQASHKFDWSIGDCVNAAAMMAKASGVPLIQRIAKKLITSERPEYREMGDESFVKKVARDTLSKAKKYGPAGIAGAIAGVTEDANAHRAAKLAYDVADRLKMEAGDPDAPRDISGRDIIDVAADDKYTLRLKLRGGTEAVIPMGQLRDVLQRHKWRIKTFGEEQYADVI